jgi:hypothetical protein
MHNLLSIDRLDFGEIWIYLAGLSERQEAWRSTIVSLQVFVSTKTATAACITVLKIDHNRISVNGEEILISTWHAKAEGGGLWRELWGRWCHVAPLVTGVCFLTRRAYCRFSLCYERSRPCTFFQESCEIAQPTGKSPSWELTHVHCRKKRVCHEMLHRLVASPSEPSGNYMYQICNIHRFCILPTEFVNRWFIVFLGINSCYFLKHR